MNDNVWLVTGGAGYIGSHVALELLDSGFKVVVIDDLSTGKLDFIPNGCEFVKGSILSESDLGLAFEKCAEIAETIGVMHIAGVKLPNESMNNPDKYWNLNAIGTLNVARMAIKYGSKAIVFSSSCSVYGSVGAKPVNELQPTNPMSTYAKTKLAAEQILEDFARVSEFSVAALRYFNVAGSGSNNCPDLSTSNLFPAVLKASAEAKSIIVHGNDYDTRDGSCVRDYLHVQDLANAHVKAALWILNNHSIFEVFNFGTGVGHSVLEILSEFENELDSQIKIEIGARREGDPASITSDASKAKEVLNWVPKYGLSEIVSSAVRSASKDNG
jgi:UDP-glucose 4-epimerase